MHNIPPVDLDIVDNDLSPVERNSPNVGILASSLGIKRRFVQYKAN